MSRLAVFQFKISRNVYSLLTKVKFRGGRGLSDKASEFTCNEIQIPTGYGYIAAKDWRRHGDAEDPNQRRVLAVHGIMDNAGTYDRLIPRLRGNLRIVAMDLPGHGQSSHIPEGLFYHKTDYLYYMRVVVDHLKWDKYSVIGHSMGGGLSLLFSTFYPREVESVVSLDIYKGISGDPELNSETTARVIEERLRMRDVPKQPEPVMTPDVAVSKLMRAHAGSINEDSARIYLKRGAKVSPCGAGLSFTRDPRLRVESIQPMDSRVLRSYLCKIKCRVLVIKAKNGLVFETPETTVSYKDMYAKICKEFRYEEVEGTHHVHLNQPEIVAPIINDFWKV